MAAIWIIAISLAAPGLPGLLDEARFLTNAGRHADALRLLDSLDSSIDPAAVSELEGLRARCHYELLDYPRCEISLRKLISMEDQNPGSRGRWRIQLAKVLSFQDRYEEAWKEVQEVIAEIDRPAWRRVAISIALRSRQYERARPHIDVLLATDADDAFARFALGILHSKAGRYREALPELERGLESSASRRDAQFEISLVLGKLKRPEEASRLLWDIIRHDPYDEEACFLFSRMLIQSGGRAAARSAALAQRYFENLKDVKRADSREEHLIASGQASRAALVRALRFERIGNLERAVREMERAAAGIPSAESRAHAAGFWLRAGLLDESKSALKKLKEPAESEYSRKLLARITAMESALETDASALAEARRKLARSTWRESEQSLEALLIAAYGAGDSRIADRTARLLLARNDRSLAALSYLVERTGEPQLFAMHAHYLTRLAAVDRRGSASRRLTELRDSILPGPETTGRKKSGLESPDPEIPDPESQGDP